jgi:hypothetical protein
MRNSLTLSVPEPCQESWQAMTPAGSGRHCMACQHVVQDFTAFSDAELVAWFAQQQDKQRTCGRFRAEQLSLTLHNNVPVRFGRRVRGHVNRWVRWAIALVLGWQTAQGQSGLPGGKKPMATTALAFSGAGATQPKSVPEEPVCMIVRGKVVYANGVPAAGVAILEPNGLRFRNGGYIVTDRYGNFTIPIGPSLQEKPTLQLRVDYEKELITISTREEKPPLLIKLSYTNETHVTGRVVPKVSRSR